MSLIYSNKLQIIVVVVVVKRNYLCC